MGLKFLTAVTGIFLILYLPRLIGWFGWLVPQRRLHCDKKHRLALIIPARNEGRAVLPLFESILAQSYDKNFFHVYVVVKEPGDEVIGYAKAIGASVYVDESQNSKGDCLDYCMRRMLAAGAEYDGYIIVDADCRLKGDFLENMNDAMESGADIITARKLVGNYTCGSAGANNLITCLNGLIWPIIDELGNRYKCAMGLTTMPITTGILIRGGLVKGWGGWPYRKTLTEDMELQRDCAVKGIRTFHYSYAGLYLEEAPSHKDTNRRRRRWMCGMVASDRLYSQGLLKRRGFRGFWDNYYILSLWLVYMYVGFLVAVMLIDLVSFKLVEAAAAFLILYICFFALSVMAVLSDWDNIMLTAGEKLLLMLLHPFFYMEYIYIVAGAVLGITPKSWEKIGRLV